MAHFIKQSIFLVILSLLSLPLFGQVDTGSIQGVVRDSTGAIVPNAKVTLASESMGTTLSTVTGNGGEYVLSLIHI